MSDPTPPVLDGFDRARTMWASTVRNPAPYVAGVALLAGGAALQVLGAVFVLSVLTAGAIGALGGSGDYLVRGVVVFAVGRGLAMAARPAFRTLRGAS